MEGHKAHGWEEDLAAYALGALPEDERAELERHLATCESCSSELERLRSAVDLLPASVEQVEPPPGLRGQILDAAREDLPEPDSGRRRRWAPPSIPRLRPAALGALAAALAGAALAGYAVRGEGGPVSATVPVENVRPGSQLSASLVREGDAWTLRASSLPPLGRDEVFQVWVERDGAVEPSTVFVPARDRTALVAIPEDLEEASELMVTREPRPGSATPTRAPLLRAELS